MPDDLWAVNAEHVDVRPRVVGDDEAVLVPARLSEPQPEPGHLEAGHARRSTCSTASARLPSARCGSAASTSNWAGRTGSTSILRGLADRVEGNVWLPHRHLTSRGRHPPGGDRPRDRRRAMTRQDPVCVESANMVGLFGPHTPRSSRASAELRCGRGHIRLAGRYGRAPNASDTVGAVTAWVIDRDEWGPFPERLLVRRGRDDGRAIAPGGRRRRVMKACRSPSSAAIWAPVGHGFETGAPRRRSQTLGAQIDQVAPIRRLRAPSYRGDLPPPVTTERSTTTSTGLPSVSSGALGLVDVAVTVDT